MKTNFVLQVAMWLVEHSEPGSADEAFAGDLQEAFVNGHSRWWCFAQALQRMTSSTGSPFRALMLKLGYCIAFAFLFPLWQSWYAPSANHLLRDTRNSAVWPASAALEISVGLLPAVLFVWIGVFVFLLVRRQRIAPMRILSSLSLGCCVIFAGAMLRLQDMVRPELHLLSRAGFYYSASLPRFSAMLFLSLVAAIRLLPDNRHRSKRDQHRGPLVRGHALLRVVQSLGALAVLVAQVSAQTISAQEAASKRLVQLIDLFDGKDWKSFQSVYVASFVNAPPDVPLGREFFRHRTGGLDIRKLEQDTPTQASMLVQEHNSDQFARISLQLEPDEPHRIVQLRMGPIDRPAEFPYGSLTDVEVIAQARARLHALADAGQFAGVMLIQRYGRTVYSDVLGEADRTRHIANTMDTRFRIGSMNKMFTAVATLQLVAAGKLQLDAPIGRYLSDYPNQDAATRVTVRHLLTHTGGTGDFFGPDFEAHRKTLRTHEDFITLFGPRPLRFTPGTRFDYSNYGFLILGAIIDRVSGESYYQYVQDHVYAVAGMVATGSEPEDVAVSKRAIGYTQEGGEAWHPNDAYLPYRGASAGGGYTSARDLLRFADALQRHKLLSAHDTQLLLTPTDAQGGGNHYGLGFQIQHEPAGVCFGHSGGSPGQSAMLEVCPEAGYTIVWLANTDPPGALLLTDYLLHRFPKR